MIRLSATVCALAVLNGCALFESRVTPLGTVVLKPERSFVVHIGSRANLKVVDKIKNPRRYCRSLAAASKVSAKMVGGKRYALKRTQCAKGTIAWSSRRLLPSGQYRVEIRYLRPADFGQKPIVLAEFKNPEFDSSEDQVPAGAVSFEEKKVKGTLNAQGGDRTDWFEIKGEGVATVTFLPGADSKLYADVFQMAGDLRRRVKRLPSSKASTVRLSKGTFIRVLSHKYEPKRDYALLRSEGSSSRYIDLSVVDLYQLNREEAVVLLESGEGVKVNQSIQIYGRRGSRREFLGACQVESVEGAQMHCRLSAQPDKRFNSYEAQAVVEG